MPDVTADSLYLLLLIIPVVFAIGSGVAKWWRDARQGPATGAETAADGEADIEAVGLFPEGRHYRLRLTNDGTASARDVHVYVRNKPIPRHRGGASAEPHPRPEVGPGESFSYRYVPSGGEQRERIVVRIEWDDASGENTKRTTVRVP